MILTPPPWSCTGIIFESRGGGLDNGYSFRREHNVLFSNVNPLKFEERERQIKRKAFFFFIYFILS